MAVVLGIEAEWRLRHVLSIASTVDSMVRTRESLMWLQRLELEERWASFPTYGDVVSPERLNVVVVEPVIRVVILRPRSMFR